MSPDETIQCYTKALELDPKNGEVYIKRGLCYKTIGEDERAIADFYRSIELNPEDIQAYHSIGWAFFLTGKNEKAIAAFKKIVDLSPDNNLAYHDLGIAFYHIDKFIDAVTALTKAIELNPGASWKSLSLRGDAYHALTEYEKAISDFTEAIKLLQDIEYPNIYSVSFGKERKTNRLLSKIELQNTLYHKRGKAYYGHCDYDIAVADFTKAIELNSKDDESYDLRGRSYMFLQDYYLAIADFSRTMGIRSEQNHTILSLRGAAYSALDDFDRAIADLTKAIELDKCDSGSYSVNKCNADLYYFRGDVYLKKKYYERAIQDFSKAIERDSKLGRAYLGRALAYAEIGESSLASKDGEIAKKLIKNEQNWI